MTPMGWLLFALMLSAKALLVLAAALGLTRLMRDRSAAERHLVWVVASACVLMLPVLSLAGPTRAIAVPDAWLSAFQERSNADDVLLRVSGRAPSAVGAGSVEAAPVVVEAVPAGAGGAPVAVRSERISRALGTQALTPAAVGAGAAGGSAVYVDVAPGATGRGAAADMAPVIVETGAAAPAPPGRVQAGTVGGDAAVSPGASWSLRSTLPVLPLLPLLVWLTGSVIMLVRMAAGVAAVRRVARTARPLLDASLLVRTHATAAEMGVIRPVRLLEGDAGAMPITFGIVQPTLLLPSSARGWTSARLNAVLRHELEHVRRHDSLSQLIAELGCALYWFNPLMWYAAKRMCVEREHACDDAVLTAGSRASDYATELLDIARTLKSPRVTEAAAIAMAGPSHLRVRVSSLLDTRRRRDRASMKLLVPAWMGAFLLITPLSSVALEVHGNTSSARTADVPTAFGVLGSRFRTDASAQPNPAAETHDADAGGAVSAPRGPLETDRLMTPPRPEYQTRLPALAAGSSFDVGILEAADLRALRKPWQDCLSGGRNTNVNSNTNDGRRTIKWSGSECSGELIVEGDVEFDPTFTRITGISRGGRVQITTEEDGVERRVTITPANSGVAYDYRVNGDRREMDAAGHEWLSSTLLLMFRRFGFMADERATSIMQRGGVNALLTEVDQLRSDYVRSSYLGAAVESGRLDDAALDRVLRIAGNAVDSDYYRTRIITSAAGRYEFTDAVREAYLGAVSGIDSDYYTHVAYSELLKKGQLTPAQVSTVLAESRNIDSDHYRATLLNEMASRYGSSAGIRAAYLAAASDLDSDYYKAGVLTNLLSSGGMSSAELAEVIDAAATIDSDHYSATVLAHVAETGLSDGTLQRAFVRAASRIDSDYQLASVLSDLTETERMDNASLLVLLEAAQGIASDHYMSELLMGVARHQRLEGEALARFERLMDGIESRSRRDKVSRALRAGTR